MGCITDFLLQSPQGEDNGSQRKKEKGKGRKRRKVRDREKRATRRRVDKKTLRLWRKEVKRGRWERKDKVRQKARGKHFRHPN